MRILTCSGAVALIVFGGVGSAAAITIHDTNPLSPPQASFMVTHHQHMRLSSQAFPSEPTSTNGKPGPAPGKINEAAMKPSPGKSDPPNADPADPPASGAATGAASLSLNSMEQGAVAFGAAAPAASAAGLQAKVGATVPQSVELQAFGINVKSLVPAAKKYDYVKMASNDVLLVDPASRKVVDVVSPSAKK